MASDASRRGGGGGGITGACCYDDGTCDDLTESDCNEAGGNWQGEDTTCDDTGVCVGACCEGEDGTTCVDNSTPDSCAADGGTWQDFGTTCDPNPCLVLPDCSCGFPAFDESGRMFLTQTTSYSYTSERGGGYVPGELGSCSSSRSFTNVQTYDPATCEIAASCSGSGFINEVTGTGNHESTCDYTTVSGDGCLGTVTSGSECADCVADIPSCTPTAISATEKTCTSDHGAVVTVTLSDECNPIMGAP